MHKSLFLYTILKIEPQNKIKQSAYKVIQPYVPLLWLSRAFQIGMALGILLQIFVANFTFLIFKIKKVGHFETLLLLFFFVLRLCFQVWVKKNGLVCIFSWFFCAGHLPNVEKAYVWNPKSEPKILRLVCFRGRWRPQSASEVIQLHVPLLWLSGAFQIGTALGILMQIVVSRAL